MKTIAIIAQKGGSGKTTLAVHMAVCAIRQNLRTALIDLDPQGSAHDWNESREDGEKLDAVKAGSGQLAALLKQAKAAGADLAGVRVPTGCKLMKSGNDRMPSHAVRRSGRFVGKNDSWLRDQRAVNRVQLSRSALRWSLSSLIRFSASPRPV
jgi:chromosome partitioning protein